MASDRSLALVTGASSGIGAALAQRLADDGHDLIVVARRRDRLESLAARLGEQAGVSVEVLVADLTDAGDRARVVARCAAAPLDLLVNNAGFSGYGPFAETDPGMLDDLVGIHVLAPLLMTRAALPGMLARGRGAVVNVASLLALSGPLQIGMGARATYAACKSFLLVFTQSLALELRDSDVRAMVCLPGMVESEFHGVRRGGAHGMPVMNAEDCARAIVAGLERGETVCIPGLDDTAPFDSLAELQQRMLRGGNATGELARRYRGE